MRGEDGINVKCLQIVNPVRAAWVINLQRSQSTAINGAETTDIFLTRWQSARLYAGPRKSLKIIPAVKIYTLVEVMLTYRAETLWAEKQAWKKTKSANETEREKKHRQSNIVCGLWWSHIVWEGADLGRDTLIRPFFSCLLRAQQHFRSSAKVLTCCGLISQLTFTLTYKKTNNTHNHTHTRSAQLGSCYNKRVVGSRHQKFQRRSAVCCAQLTCQAQR